jgi:adenylosuccinate synthase
MDRVVGIAKAYCTRVGEGPFPSEDHGADGVKIREAGNEYGATTGRPRRCGWFDVLAMRYSLELNGADGWIMTNLDVLDSFEEIKVATAYEVGGKLHTQWPGAHVDLAEVKVRMESAKGWKTDITGVRRYEDLPALTRKYVEWVEKLVGVPIVMLSVGPDRDQIIPRAGLEVALARA